VLTIAHSRRKQRRGRPNVIEAACETIAPGGPPRICLYSRRDRRTQAHMPGEIVTGAPRRTP